MDRTIEYLSGEMAGLRGEIVSGVGDRVEESLEADRGLVADYTAEVVSADVLENTVTVQFFVALKEGGTDMSVSFMPRSGGEAVPAVHEGGLRYSALATCPIEDSPNVDILVEMNGQIHSQPLVAPVYESDYAIRLDGNVRWAWLSQTGLAKDAYEAVEIFAFLDGGTGLPEPLSMERMEIAVFHNDNLADTLPVDLEQGSRQVDLSRGGRQSYREWNLHQSLDVPVSLPAAQNGDTLAIVLLAEDNYGRTASHIISHYRVRQDGRLDYEQPVWNDGTYGTEVWP